MFIFTFYNFLVPPESMPIIYNPAHPYGSNNSSGTAYQTYATIIGATANSRRRRRPYTKYQLAELEREFIQNEFISREMREQISRRVNLSDRQVKIWFQNRRMKKKRMLNRDSAPDEDLDETSSLGTSQKSAPFNEFAPKTEAIKVSSFSPS